MGQPSWAIVADHTDEVIEKFRDHAESAVAITAFLLVEEIAENIRRHNLIDTGAMRSSVYAELFDRSGRTTETASTAAARQSATSEARRKRKAAPLAVRGKVPSDPLSARVAVAVEYAIYHEMGAPRAGIPARPFVAPAVELHRNTLHKVMSDLIAGGDGGV